MQQAAVVADGAVSETIWKYAHQGVTDEPEITAYLISQLDAAFRKRIAGLQWTSSVVRNGSGSAAEEKRIGADMLLHVTVETPGIQYSKGVLVQAKRFEPGAHMSTLLSNELRLQCRRMLADTPAAFVFNYTRHEMRCGSALRFAGSTDRRVHQQCIWTSYRFFLELFRCMVGDPRVTSARVDDLPAPYVIHLVARGDILIDQV